MGTRMHEPAGDIPRISHAWEISRSAPRVTVATTRPHPKYAPERTRFTARCACGWKSHASLFRVIVLTAADEHAASVHGAPKRPRRDTLAACWREAVR